MHRYQICHSFPTDMRIMSSLYQSPNRGSVSFMETGGSLRNIGEEGEVESEKGRSALE